MRMCWKSPLQVGFFADNSFLGTGTVLAMEKDGKNREFFSLMRSGKLWETDPDKHSGLHRFFIKCTRIIFLLIQNLLDDRCLIRAAALSFTTMLSLVPFFALAFAVLKGLGVHTRLEPFIIERLSAGSQEIADRIIVYIDNTKMGSVGAVGLVALIVTVITLLGNIEEAFNDIWGVRETRTFSRKFSDYVSVVVSAPILLLAATSVTTSLQSQSLVSWLLKTEYVGYLILLLFQLVPFVSIWVALVFVYVFIPNTKVRFRSALIGGLFAAIIWQIAQWWYIHFQVGVSKYNAIYGTLSALPVFMVWIYTSWIIVLFGVEVVYAHQNRKTFFNDIHHPSLNYASREMIALVLLLAAADSYYRDKPPWTCERFAGETGIPVRIVKELLAQLVDQKYLVVAKDADRAYVPVRALEHMYMYEILKDLKNYGESCHVQGMIRIREVLQDALCRLKPCVANGHEGITVKDLVVRLHDNESIP